VQPDVELIRDIKRANPHSILSWPAGLVVGIALGVISVALFHRLDLGNDPPQSPEVPVGHATDDGLNSALSIEQLSGALAAEVQARTQLAGQVAELHAELARLREASDEAAASPLARSELQEEVGSSKDESETVLAAQSIDFNDEALLAQGMHPRDVARLHDLWADYELNRQSVNDQALREGWFMQPRHGIELAQLEQEFREGLQNDEDYDHYLYAAGQPNRVLAREVLAGSTARAAGLTRGDTILRYNDVRVFKPADLLLESARVESGKSVPVEILQDGRPKTVYLEGGPLGLVVDQSSAAPRS
jgi:hypothetical protein